MNEADIYALFLNMIDNAIEALINIGSNDRKIINLTIRNKQHLVYITCENYFENKLVKENHRYVTTKKDSDYHGYGIQSIENVVKKYNGNVLFTNDKEIFKVQILFTTQELED